jgi:hypothetical protein
MAVRITAIRTSLEDGRQVDRRRHGADARLELASGVNRDGL